jgi:hypothetical protein
MLMLLEPREGIGTKELRRHVDREKTSWSCSAPLRENVHQPVEPSVGARNRAKPPPSATEGNYGTPCDESRQLMCISNAYIRQVKH